MPNTILEMALAPDELLEKKERIEKEETEVKAKRVASNLDSLATSLTILSENLSELAKIVQVLRNVKVNDILNEGRELNGHTD